MKRQFLRAFKKPRLEGLHAKFETDQSSCFTSSPCFDVDLVLFLLEFACLIIKYTMIPLLCCICLFLWIFALLFRFTIMILGFKAEFAAIAQI